MAATQLQYSYDSGSDTYENMHARWLRFAGGEAQCAFEGAVSALLKSDDKMLDVACGTGTVARRVLDQSVGDVDLALLDASPRMLAKCHDIPAKRIQGCMTDLPFDDGTFDLVTCAWGIDVLSDPMHALLEFVRVTRAGGHICLVFCADRPAHSLIGQALRHHISWTGRGRFLDHAMLKTMAVAAGVRHVQTLHCTGPAAAMILHV